ncbi:unnamed protein product [Cyclocybe aegerita]|uniref:Uncharacterized protein n=1 Tax=Cyclocybe aegerita TaxID=1973307 RepID=A0A8S0VV01_CYCAE|nr:unnamed protein product [Cyclocybe aegerita]
MAKKLERWTVLLSRTRNEWNLVRLGLNPPPSIWSGVPTGLENRKHNHTELFIVSSSPTFSLLLPEEMMPVIKASYERVHSSSFHPPTEYAQLSSSELGILAFARLMDEASGNSVAEAPPFWPKPTAYVTVFSHTMADPPTNGCEETMRTTNASRGTRWATQDTFDWMTRSSSLPQSAFGSVLSSAPTFAPLVRYGLNLPTEGRAYPGPLFGNPVASADLHSLSFESPSTNQHEIVERKQVSGVRRTSKNAGSHRSGPYDRGSSHRRHNVMKYQHLNSPDEHYKPFSKANLPVVGKEIHSGPPPGNPFESRERQPRVAPPQSTLEELTRKRNGSNQQVESSVLLTSAPVHIQKFSENPGAKPVRKAQKASNQLGIVATPQTNGAASRGNRVAQTFVE